MIYVAYRRFSSQTTPKIKKFRTMENAEKFIGECAEKDLYAYLLSQDSYDNGYFD